MRRVVLFLWVVGLMFFGCTSTAYSGLDAFPWQPETMEIEVDPLAPECAYAALDVVFDALQPRLVTTIRRGLSRESRTGLVRVFWMDPNEVYVGPKLMGLTFSRHENHRNQSADVFIQQCEPRLWAHEFGHVMGLLDRYDNRMLMTKVYPSGAWQLSPGERAALDAVGH